MAHDNWVTAVTLVDGLVYSASWDRMIKVDRQLIRASC